MVKILIYILCEMLFLAGAIDSFKLTLCEDSGKEYENVICPQNQTITWKSIVYGESSCQDINNRDICLANVNAYFNDHCLGQNSCTLPTDILSKNSCQRPPRRLKVLFECSRGFWWREKHPTHVNTCANSLEEVMCPPRYHIHIRDIWSQRIRSDCDSIDTNCSTETLKTLCNEKRRCIPDTTNNSSLFHHRFANIQFACGRQTDYLATTNIPSTSSDNELVTTAVDVDEITPDNTDTPGKYSTNVPTDEFDQVESKSSNLGV
ncbi:uncharacterized protein LOC134726234 [Mytilus trossulus]|uniref:uncharacterized protein LOC134726234 n=1 Tax=Mytilus trossulus TaxID=6551 RepID=UPI0030040E2C